MEKRIRAAIQAACKTLGTTEVNFAVEYPKDMSYGDYASNVALVAAKEVGEAPRVVAPQLRAALLADPIPGVASIDIAGPGFLNFTLAPDVFRERVEDALEQGAVWGHNDAVAGKKVVVEYTDPNPFKEFHIGHLFTNAVGETIARLFMAGGAEVKRVNYQGDVGLHVAHALYGMQELGFTSESDISARDLGKAYALGATAYKSGDEEVVATIRAINKAIYDQNNDTLNALYKKGRTVSLDYFETLYVRLGTKFDAYFFESEAGPKGKELVLAHEDIFPKSEGARIFDGEARGLHTRVFLNKEGLPTYEAKELALAQMKEDVLGDYDISIISTANEINEYFKVLLAAMAEVYPSLAQKTTHIGHGMVRLTSGKMSSRTGDVISAFDFLEDVTDTAHERMKASGKAEDRKTAEQVALAAIKYATLKGNITQDKIFDPEQALSFEGDSGPYLQYTAARIGSILEKAAAEGLAPDATTRPENMEVLPVERLLARFTEVNEAALAALAPHTLTTYLTELAASYNAFYASGVIVDKDNPATPYKLALSAAVATTLKNGLWILGIETPARM